MTVETQLVFAGRQVIAGPAAGPALVTEARISFFGGVDPATGRVTERGHPLEGVSLAGKILVYPGGKGSTGATYTLYDMAARKTAPLAIISPEVDPVTVVGAVLGKIVSVDRIPPEFFDLVQTGQRIEIDGEHGIVRLSVQAQSQGEQDEDQEDRHDRR
jgi:predicted aconitase with swiveling domain